MPLELDPYPAESELAPGAPVGWLPALQATVDWSYDLLDPSAQTVLRRVGPFVDGFTPEAAEVVCTTVDVNSAVAG